MSPTICQSLSLLRCPLTGAPLEFLTETRVGQINLAIRLGLWGHADASLLPAPLVHGLSTPDGAIVYRIDDDIISLLPQLALRSRADVQPAPALPAEMKVVQSFYDEFGWVKTDTGRYNDSVAFSEPRQCARRYQIRCNNRIVAHLGRGDYLLDVASGAIPHPEYRDHSRHYRTRVCVDFSIRALREARAQIGDHGLFILGDITRLPLATDSLDAAISLHTLYHLPPDSQLQACDELLRVVRPHSSVIVVYVWSDSSFMRGAETLRRLPRLARRLLQRVGGSPVAPARSPVDTAAATPTLYFRPCDYPWFVTHIAHRHPVRLFVWSAVTSEFQTRFFADHLAGRLLAALIGKLEDILPGWLGRIGQYPLWVFTKPASS